MEKEDQQAVLTALEAHFEPMATPDWQKVKTLADLGPAIERYSILISLGRLDHAYILFRDRLSDATLYRLAAHRERIEWLERLFTEGVDELPGLSRGERRGYTLNTLAGSYLASGRPSRASKTFRRANEIAEANDHQQNLMVGLSNLGFSLQTCGAYYEAEDALRRSLILVRHLSNRWEAVVLQFWGYLSARLGDPRRSLAALDRSRKLFRLEGDEQGEGIVAAYLAERALVLGAFDGAQIHADEAWMLADRDRVEGIMWAPP